MSTSSTNRGRRAALEGRGIVGITETWVYPQLALVPLILAHGFAWIAGYEVGWAILITLCDALAFALLVGRGRSRGRDRSRPGSGSRSSCCSGRSACTGSTASPCPSRSPDACGWSAARGSASILLAVATWIKVWPAALLAGGRHRAAAPLRRHRRRAGRLGRSRSPRCSPRAVGDTPSASSPTRPSAGCSSRRRSARGISGAPCSASRVRRSTTTATS